MTKSDRWYSSDRLGGLRRFAAAITILNVLGHVLLGFEQSFAQPLVGLASAYATEILLECVDAVAQRRRPRFLTGQESLVDFLLSAHITGLAVSMLLYANERLMPIAFAAAVAIASKSFLRVRLNEKTRHVFNPSNFGIATTLLCFHWVGIAPPYMFTENLGRIGDWVLPFVIVCLGMLLNARFTHRLPLIAAWAGGFALQGCVRHFMLGQPIAATWMPMSGMAFLLFTFYMVTDPATTPSSARAQAVFGLCVAAAYGALMALHVVFGLFFALAFTSSVRGLWLLAISLKRAVAGAGEIVPLHDRVVASPIAAPIVAERPEMRAGSHGGL